MKILGKFQSGFSLIELVIVMVVLGILAAIAVPRYIDLQTEAGGAAADATESAIRSTFAIYLAENKTYPTPADILNRLQGGATNLTYTDGTGFTFTIGGTDYTIPAYPNADCTGTVGASTAQFQCVGNRTP